MVKVEATMEMCMVECDGTDKTVELESLIAVRAMYEALCKRSPELGRFFRTALQDDNLFALDFAVEAEGCD